MTTQETPKIVKEPALKKSTRWTREEETALTALFKSGTPTATIATQFGRSQGAINARLAMLDLISYGPYTRVAHMSRLPEDSEAPENNGAPWQETDEAELLALNQDAPTADKLLTLAAKLGRSPKSLVLKLINLGVLIPEINPDPKPDPDRPLPPAAAELAEKAAAKNALNKPLQKKSDAPTRRLKVTITPEFQAAKRTLDDGKNLLVLGSAGTGKSTFLKWICHQYNTKEQDKNYVILAPTGMAALNVGGQTIHSFFGFKAQTLEGESAWRKPRNPKLFKKLNLIIIDEISMVRADIFTAIDNFLRKFGPNPRLPFGGVQILALGDLFQLSPIVRREEKDYFLEKYGTPFFFGSPAFQDFTPLEFSHIFRQADAPFINLLTRIRHGEKSQDLFTLLNERCIDIPKNIQKSAVILAARNHTVEHINERELANLTTQERTYTADIKGKVDVKAFTTPEELILKKGARVMFTRNDAPLGRWVNGSLGEVIACDPETITVKLTSGETYDVEPIKWELTKYDIDPKTDKPVATVAGSFTQFPLTLAWALTIHKAQGQTLESCIIDLSDGGAFADGQLYVALSRARSLESLYLTQPITAQDVRTAADVKDFYSALAQ